MTLSKNVFYMPVLACRNQVVVNNTVMLFLFVLLYELMLFVLIFKSQCGPWVEELCPPPPCIFALYLIAIVAIFLRHKNAKNK